MAMTWTHDQQRVIDSRRRNLLVSAAAGSGKTAVLVERIVTMITEEEPPVDLNRLLVMTFTNAAAAQMRERIGRAIGEKLRKDPENPRLRLQAALVPHAQIQTIDSFCLSLIRNHYGGLDIDPAFRVGDEGELTLLQADVMAELLEERYQEGAEDFVRFVETYGGGKTDQGIEEVIRQVYQFCVSHPWPKEWLNQCRGEFLPEALEHLEEMGWMKFLLLDVRRQMEEFARQLDQAMEVCQEEGGPAGYLPSLRADKELVCALGEAESFSQLQARLEHASFGRLAAARGKDIDPEKKEFAAGVRDRVKKAVSKCREQYGGQTMEEIREGMQGCAPAVQMLLDLAEEYLDRYQQAKKERNLVDFGDLEHYALEILYEDGHPSQVADQLSQGYEEILVDEYQDSNSVQEALLLALSGERFGRPNVFMVGDVKQSIYRFRQARPELFLEKYRTYSREEGLYQKIELQRNFRSRSQVLESINQVFYQIMTESLGGIRYTEETALYGGGEFPRLPEEGDAEKSIPWDGEAEGTSHLPGRDVPEASPQAEEEACGTLARYRTELLVTDTGSRELSALDEEARDFTSKEIEVKLAAKRIKELTDESTGLLVWDKERKAYRRARCGDIVILLRSLSGWAETFVNGLMNEGISAYAQSQAGYFDTTEVETILSLLAVIDNPIQDIPLAAVMRSPLVGMSDEELAWMMARFKRKAKKGQDRGIYGAWRLWMKEEKGEKEAGVAKERSNSGAGRGVEAGKMEEAEGSTRDRSGAETGRDGEEKEAAEEEISQKLGKLQEMLAHFRHLADILPIHQLLERIYRESGYYAYVSAMPAGETRQANLDLLIEKAAAYEGTSYQGLFHFIRYVERLKKVDTDFGEAAVAGAQEKTVRIMSIHKSKGLEFPIVILAGMGKRFNKQDAYSRLLIDPEFGVGADFLDLEQRVKSVTLKKQVLKRRMELEGLGEELRVLYVAMTRAEEKLILTATDLHLEKKLEKWGLETDGRGMLIPRTLRALPAGKSPRALPYTFLTGAGSYLDWILMALSEAGQSIEGREIPAASFVGQEVLRQMEKQTSKEFLLSQEEGRIYDAEYRKELLEALHFAYPYEADIGLYAMMSVSELKRQSQEEESCGAVELYPERREESSGAVELYPESREESRGAVELYSESRGESSGAFEDLDELTECEQAMERSSGELLEPGRVSVKFSDDQVKSGGPARKISEGGSMPGGFGRAGGAARGTAYHRALELILGEEFSSIREVALRLDELAEGGGMLKEARKLVNARVLWDFFHSALGQRMIRAWREGRLHKEQQFMIGIPAREMGLADSDELVLVQGMIDAYMEEEDGLVLVDYKTDFVERKEELLERYHVQLEYYIRSLEQVTGKKVKEAVIYSLRLGEELLLSKSGRDGDRMEGMIR